jgi:cysteine sulfinate desulfinase/cysteine desulfurase-like protein
LSTQQFSCFYGIWNDKGRIELTVVGVDNDGFVAASQVVGALKFYTAHRNHRTHSNNEVGTLQPLKEISRGI